MSRRFAGVLIALSVLLVGACGSNAPGGGDAGSGTTSSGEPSGDLVEWADKICKSVETEIGALAEQPDIDLSSPKTARDGLVNRLNDLATALDRLLGGIKGAGPPPVDNGQETVDKTIEAFEQAKTAVHTARSKLETVNLNDPAAAKQAFADVATEMERVEALDATKTMEDNKQIDEAFEKAETCKKLDTQLSSSATPTSS